MHCNILYVAFVWIYLLGYYGDIMTICCDVLKRTISCVCVSRNMMIIHWNLGACSLIQNIDPHRESLNILYQLGFNQPPHHGWIPPEHVRGCWLDPHDLCILPLVLPKVPLHCYGYLRIPDSQEKRSHAASFAAQKPTGPLDVATALCLEELPPKKNKTVRFGCRHTWVANIDVRWQLEAAKQISYVVHATHTNSGKANCIHMHNDQNTQWKASIRIRHQHSKYVISYV